MTIEKPSWWLLSYKSNFHKICTFNILFLLPLLCLYFLIYFGFHNYTPPPVLLPAIFSSSLEPLYNFLCSFWDNSVCNWPQKLPSCHVSIHVSTTSQHVIDHLVINNVSETCQHRFTTGNIKAMKEMIFSKIFRKRMKLYFYILN